MAALSRGAMAQRLPACALAFLCLLHAAACVHLFMPVRGILGPDPLLVGDYPWHVYGVEVGVKHLAHLGRIWGYDPRFMAGYMDPPFGPLSNMPLRLLYGWVQPWVSIEVFLKLSALSAGVICPWLLIAGARSLGQRGWALVVCAFMGILIWWLGLPLRLMKWGMFLFLVTSYGSLLLIGHLMNALERPSVRSCVKAGCAISFFVFLHPGVLVALVFPALVFGVWRWKSRWKWMLITAAASSPGVLGILTFLAVPLWIFLRHGYSYSLDVSSPMLQTQGLLGPLWDLLHYREISTLANQTGRTWLDFTIYVLSLSWAIQGWRSRPWTPRGIALAGSSLLFFIVCYYGSFLPVLSSSGPYRFKIDLMLSLSLFASSMLCHAVGQMRRGRMAHRALCLFAFIGLAVATIHAGWSMAHWRFLRTELTPEAHSLVRWIQTNTDPGGRILIEDSGPLDREIPGYIKYFDGHFPALLPRMTQREFIGGPYPYLGGVFPGPCTLIPAGAASFADGILCRKDLEETSREELEAILRLYNIRWVITWSTRARVFFAVHSDLVLRVGAIEGLWLYKVRENGSFFLKGAGRCQAELDRIVLADLKPKDQEIILSYHWFDALETVPPCEMEGVKNVIPMTDDPVPFIKLKNPPARLEIRTKRRIDDPRP